MKTEELKTLTGNILGIAEELRPDLKRLEEEARLELAMSIVAMDRAENVPGRHNLQEQADSVVAMERYGQALADFIRMGKS